jgi:hypothetical protein
MDSEGSQHRLSHAISYLSLLGRFSNSGGRSWLKGDGYHARRRFAATASISDVVVQEVGTGGRERKAVTEVRQT